MRKWILVCALLAVPLSAQDNGAAEPAEASAERVASLRSMFNWRVGGSLALTHGAMITPTDARRSMPDEGFVGEFALSARVAHRESGVSATVRTCWGCHDLALEEASFQWQPWDFMTVRAGRLSVNAGGAATRHDFAGRRTITKPLTRIMGNMPRQREFNHGVLPMPYVDNGVSVGAGHYFGRFGIHGEAMVLKGLQGFGPDIDFIASRRFRNNNREPALAARMTFDAPHVSTTVFYTWGKYDADARRSYHIASADTRIRAGPLTIEAEFAARQTEFTDPDGDKDDFLKYGWWARGTWQVIEPLYLVGAVDAMYVRGIFLSNNGPTTNEALAVADDNNRVVRYTVGAGFTLPGGVMLRATGEYWDFSDFSDAWVIQAGLGWAF
jgi:hypothetical protein